MSTSIYHLDYCFIYILMYTVQNHFCEKGSHINMMTESMQHKRLNQWISLCIFVFVYTLHTYPRENPLKIWEEPCWIWPRQPSISHSRPLDASRKLTSSRSGHTPMHHWIRRNPLLQITPPKFKVRKYKKSYIKKQLSIKKQSHFLLSKMLGIKS